MKLRTLLIAILATASLVGCSGTTPSRQASTTGSASTVSSPPGAAPSTSSAAPAVTTTAADTAGREAADRHAVEAAWTKFWIVYVDLMKIPATRRQSVIGAVAIDPARRQMLAEITTFNSTKRSLYGTVINHPNWTTPIAGKATATMSDCMDQSRFGSSSLTTKKKLTVGVARDNTRVSFVKSSDGVWRVQNITYLLDQKC